MTKREFLEQLQKMLARELDAAAVEDNVRYYSDYIDNAVRGGKSEAQVLAELGDPRMIARTILDVEEKRADETVSWEDGTVYTESDGGAYHAEEDFYGRGYDTYQEEEGYGGRRHFYDFRPHGGGEGFHMFLSGWKAWLLLIVLLAVLFIFLRTAFVIFWRLLPFLLVAWAAVSLYRWLTHR